jgi:hypothetical protein
MEELKEKAWNSHQTHHAVMDQLDFNIGFDDGFDAGVNAERERVKRLLDHFDLNITKYEMEQLFPEQEQRSETDA